METDGVQGCTAVHALRDASGNFGQWNQTQSKGTGDMSEENLEDISLENISLEMPNLDVPNPPSDLTYTDYEDFLNREILNANGITLSEAEIIAALEHSSSIMQAAAAHTLGSLSSQAAATPLKGLLTSSSDLVKVEAAYALARLEISEGRETLINCLDYPLDAYFCPPIAAGYLAKLGDPQGYQTIAGSLDIDNAVIKMAACKQLYFFLPFDGQEDKGGNPIDVFHEFGRALDAPDANIQWQALAQLREIRSPKSVPILERYIENSTDEGLSDVARRILDSTAS